MSKKNTLTFFGYCFTIMKKVKKIAVHVSFQTWYHWSPLFHSFVKLLTKLSKFYEIMCRRNLQHSTKGSLVKMQRARASLPLFVLSPAILRENHILSLSFLRHSYTKTKFHSGSVQHTQQDQAEKEREATKPLEEKVLKWRHPLILCHGLLGFDNLELGIFGQFPYWGGTILSTLREHGDLHVARVSPTADVSVRAKELKAQVEAFLERNKQAGYTKINLLGTKVDLSEMIANIFFFEGHSMGGLDARYYVSKLGGHEVVRRVITLAKIGRAHV